MAEAAGSGPHRLRLALLALVVAAISAATVGAIVLELDMETAATAVDPQERVVRVVGLGCARSIGGSGALVGDDLVLTSGHLVVGVPEVTVLTSDGSEFPADVVHVDRTLDAAVLRVFGLGAIPEVEFGDAATGDVGQVEILSAQGERVPQAYVVDRRIRASTDNVGRTEVIERRSLQLSAEIVRGDSGALLFDERDRAVGLIWSTSKRGETAYAVRGDELSPLIETAKLAPSGPGGC